VRGHVDPETLAAFREELLPRRKAGQVAAHLAECPQCAGLDAQLAGLSTLLAHTPAPPMPDALTARIEAALAAEAATRSAQAPAGVPGTEAAAGTSSSPAGEPGARPRDTRPRDTRPRDTRPRDTRPRDTRPRDNAGAARGGRRQWGTAGRSRLALRIAFATAAVVVIAGGGFGVSRLFLGGPAVNGASSSASGSGAAGRAPGAGPEQRSAPGNSPLGANPPGAPSGGEHAASGSLAGYRVVASGTNYRAGQLKAQVRDTLIKFPGSAQPHASGTASPAPFSPAALCLAGVTQGLRPRLVDMARYEGKPATVVVVPAGAHTLRALVFGQRCPAAGASPLDSTTLPSPG
jgi:hypothetical protein